jgi:hypothetical protein
MSCLVTFSVYPRHINIIQLIKNPNATSNTLPPICSGELLPSNGVNNDGSIEFDRGVAELMRLNKKNSFAKTCSFRHSHIVRPGTHSGRRSNAAAISPSQDQTKTPTAIIFKMSVHVEFMAVQGRGTPALVVTGSGGGVGCLAKAVFDPMLVVLTEVPHSLIHYFLSRYVFVLEDAFVTR